MSKGWIKLHRSLLGWRWFDKPNTLVVFIYLLLNANHQKNTYKGYDIQIGQLVTGRRAIAKNTGLSERNVRTALVDLQTTHEVTIKTTNKFSIISINNWDKYQLSDPQTARKSTNRRPHYKNDKEINKYNSSNSEEIERTRMKLAKQFGFEDLCNQ